MMGKEALVFVATATAIVRGCSGFSTTPRWRRFPTSTTTLLGGGVPGGVDEYFDSFGDDGGGQRRRKGVGGVDDYLDSLGGGGDTESAGREDAARSQREGTTGTGGMFNVQSNYFGSLGSNKDEGDTAAPPDIRAGPRSTSGNDVGDLWDAAALLNFNIGPSPDASQPGTSPWENAAAVQRSDDSDDEPTIRMTFEERMAHDKARLCPKLLLTQRAIQSFIYLCEECRDPHSGKWVEDCLNVPGLSKYHGTGAFNVTKYPTWDAILFDLMHRPNEKMIVSAKRRGRGHGGWSKDNPYLRERWIEFEVDIRPASLVQRLLPVREQLAREFVSSLDVIRAIDERIMTTGAFLDPAALDRISADTMVTLRSVIALQEAAPSPLFQGNFDLLHSLCTQAAAHRLLRDMQTHSQTDVTTQWYEQFYADHVPLHFDGDQRFGQADAFLGTLLSTAPSLVTSPTGEPIGWTDPLWVGQHLIGLRSEIAWEWKDVMSEVKEDHAKLNHDLVRVMMERTMDESGDDLIQIEEQITFDDVSDSAGAFE